MKSLSGLARKLGVPLRELQELAATAASQYCVREIAKGGGKLRTISNPRERLKRVQKQIYRRLLRPLALAPHLHGSVPGRSPRTNVEQHLARRYLTRIDLAGFFPSVTPRHVYAVWISQVGCGPGVASLLTSLTTVNFSLPQGAPTSPALANLVLTSADESILKLLAHHGFPSFTRYVDDLGISGEYPHSMITEVAKILQREGFQISRKKLTVSSRNQRQEITGYIANSGVASIGREYRAKVRAAVHGLEKMDARTDEYLKTVRSVRGRIQHLRRTNPGAAQRLDSYLDGLMKRGQSSKT